MIPEDVRRFVHDRVPSVPFLEAMLLFQREPARPRGPDEVASALYLAEHEVLPLLDSLRDGGLLRRQPEGRWIFAPADEGLAQLVRRLAACYAASTIEVTGLIHAP